MNTKINLIENTIVSLEKEVNSLEGKISLLKEQFNTSSEKLAKLKDTQILNVKAIELLNFVQKATKEVIKNIFENTITRALQFIHQSNKYAFELEFKQRGNLNECNFKVVTPTMKEAHDVIDTNAGGSTDIISLALRFILLEVSKHKGFIFIDEPEKHLDSPETIQKMIEFVKEMQQSTGRQIIWITHKEEVVNTVETPIIITRNNSQEQITKSEPLPKKKGRPKKGEA